MRHKTEWRTLQITDSKITNNATQLLLGVIHLT